MINTDLINMPELKSIAEKLIRDRTQADVDYALELRSKSTYSEQDLKGAYNISDRNRIGRTVNYIAELLRTSGNNEANMNIREDWNVYDIIKPSDNNNVLSALICLKKYFPDDKITEIPESLDGLTYQKANALENVLYDFCGVFLRIGESWIYCGEAFASDFDPFNWQGWDDYTINEYTA